MPNSPILVLSAFLAATPMAQATTEPTAISDVSSGRSTRMDAHDAWFREAIDHILTGRVHQSPRDR